MSKERDQYSAEDPSKQNKDSSQEQIESGVVCLPIAWIEKPDQPFGFVLSEEAVSILGKHLRKNRTKLTTWVKKYNPQSGNRRIKGDKVPRELMDLVGEGGIVLYSGIKRDRPDTHLTLSNTLQDAGILPENADYLLVMKWRY